jgi:hypothetical protein
MLKCVSPLEMSLRLARWLINPFVSTITGHRYICPQARRRAGNSSDQVDLIKPHPQWSHELATTFASDMHSPFASSPPDLQSYSYDLIHLQTDSRISSSNRAPGATTGPVASHNSPRTDPVSMWAPTESTSAN